MSKPIVELQEVLNRRDRRAAKAEAIRLSIIANAEHAIECAAFFGCLSFAGVIVFLLLAFAYGASSWLLCSAVCAFGCFVSAAAAGHFAATRAHYRHIGSAI